MESFNDFMMDILNSPAWIAIVMLILLIGLINLIIFLVKMEPIKSVISMVQVLYEKIKFNNGYCRKCKHKMTPAPFTWPDNIFRAYICKQCGNHVLIKNHELWLKTKDIVRQELEREKNDKS